MTDIEPDGKVRSAMNEINAAVRMRAAAVEKAEADKVMVIKRAEASSEAKYLEGALLSPVGPCALCGPSRPLHASTPCFSLLHLLHLRFCGFLLVAYMCMSLTLAVSCCKQARVLRARGRRLSTACATLSW